MVLGGLFSPERASTVPASTGSGGGVRLKFKGRIRPPSGGPNGARLQISSNQSAGRPTCYFPDAQAVPAMSMRIVVPRVFWSNP
jgi:hypothetical protein